jgi:hypothetical protein
MPSACTGRPVMPGRPPDVHGAGSVSFHLVGYIRPRTPMLISPLSIDQLELSSGWSSASAQPDYFLSPNGLEILTFFVTMFLPSHKLS